MMTFEEINTICNKGIFGNHFHFNQKLLYSRNSTLIILYSYPHYSTMSIQIHVSYIRCETAVINPCDKQIHSNDLFSQDNDYYLNIKLAKYNCVTVLLSPDMAYIENKETNNDEPVCFFAIDTKYNYKNQLWYFWSSGFLQNTGFYNSMIRFRGFPTKEGKKIIIGHRQNRSTTFIQPYCWHHGEWGRECSFKSTLIDKTFYFDCYITTPKRENSLTTHVRLYTWTYSWMQFSFQRVKKKGDGYTPLPFSFNKTTHMYDISEHRNEILSIKVNNLTIHGVKVDLDIKIESIYIHCQEIIWNQAERLTQYHSNLLIALPFKFLSFSLKAKINSRSGTGDNRNISMEYNWIPMDLYHNNNKRETMCPIHPKKLSFEHNTRFGVFSFTKNYGSSGCHKKVETCKPKMYSWVQASKLCRSEGKNLPQFLNRRELDAFLSLLKLKHSIYVIQAIYIGLRKNKGNKVSRSIDTNYLNSLRVTWNFGNPRLENIKGTNSKYCNGKTAYSENRETQIPKLEINLSIQSI